MTPAQKIERILAMRESAVGPKMMGFRMRHPDWSEEKIEDEARYWAMWEST